MNTTHSTSEITADMLSYTVVGGESLDKESSFEEGFSVVLLNRGAKPFRQELFGELTRLGANDVVSIETFPPPADMEELSKRHRNLKFMIFSQRINQGAALNAAFREILSPYAFVVQGDMKINASSISVRVVDKIEEADRICTVPVFFDKDGEALPTLIGLIPDGRGGFSERPAVPHGSGSATLVPWDYAGIYSRIRHFAIGGFDPAIDDPWWQKLEYGLRAWLWGEEIRTHPSLKMSYADEPHMEDTSKNRGYRRFFLKTLAVKKKNDKGILPRSALWRYLKFSGESYPEVKQDWKDIRNWVLRHGYKFARESSELLELWKWSENI